MATATNQNTPENQNLVILDVEEGKVEEQEKGILSYLGGFFQGQ